MPKAMSLSGIVVAILLLLVFGLDLALEIPFGRASWGIDVAFIVCALLLAYLSWSTYRQTR